MSESIDRGMTLALESPDKVVRSLAIRRVEVQQELAKLDGFLGAYAELSSGRSIASLASVASPAASPLKAKPPVPSDFGAEVVDILVAHGTPMQFPQLCRAYAARHGAEPEQNIRKKLKRREDVVRMVDGRGFWPVDRPVPEGDNGAGVVAH